jgi:hypothetical protein
MYKPTYWPTNYKTAATCSHPPNCNPNPVANQCAQPAQGSRVSDCKRASTTGMHQCLASVWSAAWNAWASCTRCQQLKAAPIGPHWSAQGGCGFPVKPIFLYWCPVIQMLGIILNCHDIPIHRESLHYPSLPGRILSYPIVKYTALYDTIRYYTIIYSSVVWYTLLWCNILYYAMLWSTMLWYDMLCYTILY